MSRKAMVLLFTLILTVLGVISGPSAKAQTTYSITDLGTLGGFSIDRKGNKCYCSYGQAINAAGHVTGYSFTIDPLARAFLYSGGPLADIGTIPGGTLSFGYSINKSDQITGYADVASGEYHAFLYTAGTMTDLGTLPGANYSTGSSVNDSGWVTGDGGNGHGFLYTGGAMKDLGTLPGGNFSVGYGINASGQVTGYSTTSGDLATHAVLYSVGTVMDLGTLAGGNNSAGAAVNASGEVTGYSNKSGDSTSDLHPVLYSGGTVTDLGNFSGGNYGSGLSINTSGQVVGYSSIRNTAGHPFLNSDYHAFLYAAGHGMIDLNSLLPSGSGWILNIATGINDAGQITGYGQTAPGVFHAFLLSPSRVPFSTLNAIVEIGERRKTSFEVRGRFTLGTHSDGIDPVEEAVMLQLGSFSITIPKSSFSKTHHGSYTYEGKLNGVALEMEIRPVTADIFRFRAEGIGGHGLPTTNPVAFTLTIGNDTGTLSLKGDFDERRDHSDDSDLPDLDGS